MSVDVPLVHWTSEKYVDLWNKGAFTGRHRVQLVEGEVWDLGPIGVWHGDTVSRLSRLLHRPGVTPTTHTLPIGNASLPDPDVWVRGEGAEPIGSVRGYPIWDAADVLLVVEVADSTRAADLGPKARLYSSGGIEHYWVVTRSALHVFSKPTGAGYAETVVLRSGDVVALPYAGGDLLSVTELLG